MSHGDATRSATPSRHALREMEAGHGDWETVPKCVRETLLAILGSPMLDAPSDASAHDTRVLLPLRRCGPKTDLSTTLKTLWEAQHLPATFVPNMQPAFTNLHERLSDHHPNSTRASSPAVAVPAPSASHVRRAGKGNKKEDTRHSVEEGLVVSDDYVVEEPLLLPDMRVYYGHVVEAPLESPRGKDRNTSHSSFGASKKRTRRVVRPLAMDTPTVKRIECVRHRRDVTGALMRVHAEIDKLHGEAENSLVRGLYDAMRLDLRRAKIVFGEIKAAEHPTEEQEQALAAFSESFAVLKEATRELVSAFLTQEEKRFLGISTHKYQTRAERCTTYQYTTSAVTTTKGQNSEKRMRLAAGASPHTNAHNGKEEGNEKVSGGQVKEAGRRPVHLQSGANEAVAPPPTAAAAAAAVNSGGTTTRRKRSDASKDNADHDPKSNSAPQLRRLPDSLVSSVDLVHPDAKNGSSLGLLPIIKNPDLSPAKQEEDDTPAAKETRPNDAGKTGHTTASVPPKKVSCSTLSSTSSINASQVGAKPAAKPAATAPPPEETPASVEKNTGGFQRLDIKRFLIDSDSDSESEGRGGKRT